jgi:hypothetical protein
MFIEVISGENSRMKLRAIIGFTFREGLARKTIIGFAAISTLFLLLVQIRCGHCSFRTPSRSGPRAPQQQVRLSGSQHGDQFVGQMQASG